MRRPVRQVEKKRPVFICLNDFNCLIGVVIRQVLWRLKSRPAVKARRKVKGRPQETIDRIKVLARLNHVLIVATTIQTTGHQQALCKALFMCGHAVDPT